MKQNYIGRRTVRYRKPYRIRKKKSILKNRFFWLSAFVLIIIGGVFYLIFFSPVFQIKKIEIAGTEKISLAQLKKNIESQIQKRLLFFPTKSIFLVNLEDIRNNLSKSFVELAKADLKRNLPDNLSVKIEERKPEAIFNWQGNIFLIDKEGIIFDIASSDVFLPEIESETFKENPELGKNAIDKERLSLILDIRDKLKKNFNLDVLHIVVSSEERLNFKTIDGFELYFAPRENVDWQMTELGLILEKQIPPEKRGKLEYIDLRFSRVYYKYK